MSRLPIRETRLSAGFMFVMAIVSALLTGYALGTGASILWPTCALTGFLISALLRLSSLRDSL